MTQEEKSILLRDLCARMPYGVKGIRDYADEVVTLHFIIPNCKCPNDKTDFIELEFTNLDCCPINEFKPYLRPMSSMIEEEEVLFRCELPVIAKTDAQLVAMRMELFLKGHLDFNHLIEKGLALEAPEDMYR